MTADEFSGLSLPLTLGIPYAGDNSGLMAPANIRGSGAFLYGLGQCVRALRNGELVYLILRKGKDADKVRQGLQVAAKQLDSERKDCLLYTSPSPRD